MPTKSNFFEDFIFFFGNCFQKEGKGGRKTGRETWISGQLPLTRPPLGTQPTTQVCALNGNLT